MPDAFPGGEEFGGGIGTCCLPSQWLAASVSTSIFAARAGCSGSEVRLAFSRECGRGPCCCCTPGVLWGAAERVEGNRPRCGVEPVRPQRRTGALRMHAGNAPSTVPTKQPCRYAAERADRRGRQHREGQGPRRRSVPRRPSDAQLSHGQRRASLIGYGRTRRGVGPHRGASQRGPPLRARPLLPPPKLQTRQTAGHHEQRAQVPGGRLGDSSGHGRATVPKEEWARRCDSPFCALARCGSSSSSLRGRRCRQTEPIPRGA